MKQETQTRADDVPKQNEEDLMATYLREKYVTVKLVRTPGQNVGVVTRFEGFKAIKYKDDDEVEQTIQKPLYIVEIGGHDYEFTLSQSQARQLFEELGATKPSALIGKKLKFTVAKAGNNEYVAATIVP